MKFISYLILFTTFSMVFSMQADSTTSQIEGEAIIVVDNIIYTLTLKKCYSTKNIDDGQTSETFIISTHQSRKSNEIGPRFSAIGSNIEKKGFKLQIGGGFSKGGTDYRGKMPFESFKDNKLTFEGKANSIKKENDKLVKDLVPIKITVSCHK